MNIIYSNQFLLHETGDSHPECSDRVRKIVSYLENSKINNHLNWIKPRPCSINELLKIHSKEHIYKIKSICEKGGGFLDTDTPVCKQSYEIGLLSAGSWLTGLDNVLENKPSFVLSRPPGHHAESERAMGFCLFSNAALAAIIALDNPKINKVAIFDWDVHHGNGTEEIVKFNPDILYTSIHQFPFYPGTGFASEKGKYNNVINVPLRSGSGWEIYETELYNKIIPGIKNFNPDLIIISAGFDAHIRDPLGCMNLSSEDFGKMTNMMLNIQQKILFGLEGGYNIDAISESVRIVISKLI